MFIPKYAGGLGLRDIEIFNLSLLARETWRIVKNPDTLSARILKAVYFPSVDLLEATLGSHPSRIWRSLIEGRDAMKQGLIRRIGSGRDTHAWNQNWIPRDHMLRPVACKEDNPPVRVSDFIHQDTMSWNTTALEEFFYPMDIEHIRKIPLSTRRHADEWAWHYERSGVLSVRSVYRMIVRTRQQIGRAHV